MKLEVRHLRLIRAVAEEGSVTKAAGRLHLTQSALSHQLKDAEEKFGTLFFSRQNKRMVLTAAGERLLKSARSVLDEMKRAEEDIRHIAREREGVLRVSTECYTCYHWLPPLLTIFNEAHPRVEVQIVVEATRAPHRALLERRIDLGLVTTPVRDSRITYRPLFTDEMVVVVASDHPLAGRPFVAPADLAGEHLLLYTMPEENRVVREVLAPAGVTPRKVSSVQLTEAIVEMVKANLGVGVLAKWSVAPQVEAGLVSALPLTKKGLHRRWSAATHKSSAGVPYLDEFVRLMGDNPVLSMGEGAGPRAGRVRCLDGLRPAAEVGKSRARP